MQATIPRPPFGLFASLMLAICSSGLTGCGGGPSDSNILDAVKRYCERTDSALFGMLSSIKLPTRPAFAGLADFGDEVTISDVRVVKRGKPFRVGSVESSSEGFPVRVFVKGMRVAKYSKFVGSEGKFVHDTSVSLPFEGETDFVIQFQSPDKRKVDPGPGKWMASPGPQNCLWE